MVATLHTLLVWLDPKGFVPKMQRSRSILNGISFGLLLPEWAQRGLDNTSEPELLLARIMFVVFYFFIGFIAIASIS